MKLNLMHEFSICSIIRLEIRWRTHAGYCFNTSCVLLQVAMGFVSIERDEGIAEELQDGNKSDRGAESQDS